MRITAKLYNSVKNSEKYVLRDLAKVFKSEEIGFEDVYAYFFARHSPVSFDKFNRGARTLLRRMGLSVDRVQLITYNFLPTRNEMQSIFSKYSWEMQTILSMTLYTTLESVFGRKTNDYRRTDLSSVVVKIPQHLIDKYHRIDDSFFCSDNYGKIAGVSGELMRNIGFSISTYRIFYTKMIGTKGILINQTTWRFARLE